MSAAPLSSGHLCILGDLHGHLQLGLAMAALWQKTLGVKFEAVLLCGDVGTFTSDAQLDNATRSHARKNPCELEFMHLWMQSPQPEWSARIFEPVAAGGLGLECPVVMTHGNHEGFTHLETLFRTGNWQSDVALSELPAVDPQRRIRYLPCGTTARTRSGVRIGAIGGIEQGQRGAWYHPLAYINEDAVLHMLKPANQVDILITHQGPSAAQGAHGSETLQWLLDAGVARCWFHGHSTPIQTIQQLGPHGATTVMPLNDVGFGHPAGDPGKDGYAWFDATGAGGNAGEPPQLVRDTPPCWREFRQKRWRTVAGGLMVCPALWDAALH